MLRIYGADLSSPANKVRFVANFLGLKYEYIQVKLREGEQRRPEFLKMNPIGKVPAIDDNGFCLFESGAIIKYFAEKEKSSIFPSGLKERAVAEQWIDFITNHVALGMHKVVFNRLFAKNIPGATVDERSIQDGLSFLSKYFPIVDEQLSKGKYFLGNNITLADFTLLAALDPAEASDVDLTPYKNIVRWRAELKSQDFYTKCHRDYKEKLQMMFGQPAKVSS
jgi:glutathione S-transferase